MAVRDRAQLELHLQRPQRRCAQVGNELGVRYVLEGSVRTSGNRMRISAQLVEAQTGNHLWADRYDRAPEDVFAVQDEITESVLGCIQPEVYAAEHERVKREPPHSLDAWETFIRAMFLYCQHSDASTREALTLLDDAVGMDPSYSQAHGLRGSALPGVRSRAGRIGRRRSKKPPKPRHAPWHAIPTSRGPLLPTAS